MAEYKIRLDDREERIVLEAAKQKDMSPEATLRHWVRCGQMLDMLLVEAEGSPIGYLDDQGDFHDPFHPGPKMAPYLGEVTKIPPTLLSCGCEVGTCICDFEKD